MAEIRILTPDDLAARAVKPSGRGRGGRRRSEERSRIIESYKQALRDATPGFGGDVALSEGEEKRLVRQNLKAAAQELGKALDFRPVKDTSRIHFRVITLEEHAARPKRGGRPKQQLEERVAPEVTVEAAPAPRRSRRTRQEAA